MGMYTDLEEDLGIKFKKGELKKTPKGEALIELFEGGSIKFYAYWTHEYMLLMDDFGKRGIIKGEIIVRYEEGDLIKCRWDKTGFHYKFGVVAYPEAWINGLDD